MDHRRKSIAKIARLLADAAKRPFTSLTKSDEELQYHPVHTRLLTNFPEMPSAKRVTGLFHTGLDVSEAVSTALWRRRDGLTPDMLTQLLKTLGVRDYRVEEFQESAFEHTDLNEGEGHIPDHIVLSEKNHRAIEKISRKRLWFLMALQETAQNRNKNESLTDAVQTFLELAVAPVSEETMPFSGKTAPEKKAIAAAKRIGHVFDDVNTALMMIGIHLQGGKAEIEAIRSLLKDFGAPGSIPNILPQSFDAHDTSVESTKQWKKDLDAYRAFLATRVGEIVSASPPAAEKLLPRKPLNGTPVKINPTPVITKKEAIIKQPVSKNRSDTSHDDSAPSNSPMNNGKEHPSAPSAPPPPPTPEKFVRVRNADGTYTVFSREKVFPSTLLKGRQANIDPTLARNSSQQGERTKPVDRHNAVSSAQAQTSPQCNAVKLKTGYRQIQKMQKIARDILVMNGEVTKEFSPSLKDLAIASRCAQDALPILHSLTTVSTDPLLLKRADQVLHYSVNLTVEYMRLQELVDGSAPEDFPFHRKHELHHEYVLALVHRLVTRLRGMNYQEQKQMRDLVCEAVFGTSDQIAGMETIKEYVDILFKEADETVTSSQGSGMTVFEYIKKHGDDNDFEPTTTKNFRSTNVAPGSEEKIEALSTRAQKGQPLWHSSDRVDYTGLEGAIRPREG